MINLEMLGVLFLLTTTPTQSEEKDIRVMDEIPTNTNVYKPMNIKSPVGFDVWAEHLKKVKHSK